MDEYVDLGLPSGTLWMERIEKGIFYSYREAKRKFGNELPSKEQFEELKYFCKWEWIGNGYKVTGPNGNAIVLPAEGYQDRHSHDFSGLGTRGIYWSSTNGWKPIGPSTFTAGDNNYVLCFDSDEVDIDRLERRSRFSLRLVRQTEESIQAYKAIKEEEDRKATEKACH